MGCAWSPWISKKESMDEEDKGKEVIMLPLIILAPALIGGIWFFSTGGLDDIGENISLLIMGALLGIILMKVLKL